MSICTMPLAFPQSCLFRKPLSAPSLLYSYKRASALLLMLLRFRCSRCHCYCFASFRCWFSFRFFHLSRKALIYFVVAAVQFSSQRTKCTCRANSRLLSLLCAWSSIRSSSFVLRFLATRQMKSVYDIIEPPEPPPLPLPQVSNTIVRF